MLSKISCRKSSPTNNGPEPEVVIFLTCDLTGVLPLVSILGKEAAAYHFEWLYSKSRFYRGWLYIAIESTFSTCLVHLFSLGLLVSMLIVNQKNRIFNSQVYLVNTGWTGGPHGVGKRFSIPTTRRIVNAIQAGELKTTEKTMLMV